MAKQNEKSDLFPDASDKELAAVLKKMVETGDISPDAVNSVCARLNKDIKAASQTDVEKSEKQLSPEQKERLLGNLKVRFKANKKRHKGIEWSKVEARLNEAVPEKLWSLYEMERTGGEPDVVGLVEETGEYEFWDFSKKSPKGRRNVCYDREGQDEAERRGDSPIGNAVDMAEAMGLGGILNRDQYENKLQKLGEFDVYAYSFDENTSSWINTPKEKREAGVALTAHRHGSGVYVDGGGPDGHYVGVGFRGWLRV